MSLWSDDEDSSQPATRKTKRPLPSTEDTPSSSAPLKKAKASESLSELPPEKAAFRDGYIAGKRPKASDYILTVEVLLLRSMREYESRVSTINAFPGPLLGGQWARTTWKNAGEEKDEVYEITDHMVSLICQRGSRIRGSVASVVRSQIIGTYDFSRQTTVKAITKNITLSAALLKGAAFHYKDPATTSGYAQSKIISEILHLCWFDEANSPGIIYPRFFNPISLNTLALIFVMIDHCLKEWSTGKHVRADFSEKLSGQSYCAYVTDLEAWSDLNKTVVANTRKKYYLRARRSAGIIDNAKQVTSLVGDAKDRARDEMAGRTGETDSEMSGVDDS